MMFQYKNVRMILLSSLFMFFCLFIISGACILIDTEFIKTFSFLHHKTSFLYGLSILYIGIIGILSFILISSNLSRILFFFSVTVAFNIFDIFLRHGFFGVDQFYLFGYFSPILTAVATIVLCFACFFMELYRTRKRNQYFALTSIIQIIPLSLVLILYLLKLGPVVESISRGIDSTAGDTSSLMPFLFLSSGIISYAILMIPIFGERCNEETSLLHNNLSKSRGKSLRVFKCLLSSLALLPFGFILYATAKLSLLGQIVLFISLLLLAITFFLKRQFVTIFSRIVGRLFVVISLIALCYLYFENFFYGTFDLYIPYYRAFCSFYLVVVMIINLFELNTRNVSNTI